ATAPRGSRTVVAPPTRGFHVAPFRGSQAGRDCGYSEFGRGYSEGAHVSGGRQTAGRAPRPVRPPYYGGKRSMNGGHWTEEDLINHAYGIGPEDGHLDVCAGCRVRWGAIRAR